MTGPFKPFCYTASLTRQDPSENRKAKHMIDKLTMENSGRFSENEHRLKKIEKTLDQLLQQSITWLNDDEVCKLLNIPQKVLDKLIASGSIPPNCYKTSSLGIRVFNKNRLLGL